MNTEHLQKIKEARLKYKPDVIKCLFIAEAPPSAEDRFFYFEDVWYQDSLYLEMMKALFPPEPSHSGILTLDDFPASTSTLRNQKEEYLIRFMNNGYYLIDALDRPMPPEIYRTKDKIRFLEQNKDQLVKKVKELVDEKTPIVLISIPVFNAMGGRLKYHKMNVIHDIPIEFPGSGQQANFREKMTKVLPKIQQNANP
jgi:hypothetical protein